MADEPRYAGMTVNERLAAANLLTEFNQAALQRNREQIIAVLQKVELTYDQAAYTVDTILTNPARYGY